MHTQEDAPGPHQGQGVQAGEERYGRKVGDQLRRIRQQKGLSLLDVQAASKDEFKASVLGAYERGERSISVPRLARLAEFYDMPVGALLPRDEARLQAPVDPLTEGMSLNLSRLRELETNEARVLLAYVRSLQALRGDWAADILTIRGSDLRAVACVLDRSPAELVRRIEELGLRM